MTVGAFVLSRRDDQVYVDSDWPDEAMFSLTLLRKSDPAVMQVADGQLKVTVANGYALYDLESFEPLADPAADPLELQAVRGRLVESTRRV